MYKCFTEDKYALEKNQFYLPFSVEEIQHNHHLCVKKIIIKQYKQNIETADSVLH